MPTPLSAMRLSRAALVLCIAAANATPVFAVDPATPAERGHYLALAGDCAACHSAPGGKPMAGGLAISTPIGAIVSSNITPSKTHGIGNYTFEQFSDALRKGVRADGARLYPAMPYTAYAKVSDDDVKALYAYFMGEVAAVDTAPPATDLPFPFDIRLSMAAWNLLFLDDKPFVPDAARSAQWNRGAYLVQGLAHCGTCHTPRNLLMAEKSTQALAGADIAPWQAPNITSDAFSGVGGWSEQELTGYFQHGEAKGKAQAAGPMAEAIDDSLSHLTDADRQAIAAYLLGAPARRDPNDTRAAYAWGEPGGDVDSVRGVPWPTDRDQLTGPQLYDAHCATCHGASGQGSFEGGLPSLFHNSALGRMDTSNLVMVILDGVHRGGDGGGVQMPAFANQLSDTQLATLGNWLLQHYGRPQAVISVAQVARSRTAATSASLIWMARAGLGAVVLLLMIAIAVGARHLRRRRQAGT